MQIVLTGGTGYIGSALVRRLAATGHDVTALVRNEEAAGKVRKHGADAAVGDAFDVAWTAERFAAADAVVHLAATGGPDTERLDRAVVAAAVQALGGTGRPYVHTSGVWLYGDNADIAEDSPLRPPALTAWRLPVEASVLDADLAATVVTPGIVYGAGGGIPAGVLLPGRDEAGRVRLVGDGGQHWTTIHVDDAAALYALIATRGEALGRLLAVSGASPTVREIAEAAAGPGGVVAEPVEASRERFGPLFADALLLDQQASGDKARSLGWAPQRPALLDELRAG
ncbi:NAD-dependent epimerase/dehydratase family protein [Dactylosporangium sp. AC04546]|uniref:NAD-dependent epimerase/dehydratase family protein n=1 Tax=Dactylosporangium sp. AC04546 TaxID=2862460 RepID=UPI001EE1525C|nr:NAD-dependent epimerase/dehydratase family protein [Dactylosporangium sp. AC04546]WVK80175.1 NAD-dependent epimerase/dehydratase family protein [Dactylosporangium sp. AC04546]